MFRILLSLITALVLAISMVGSARADCGPYVAMFEEISEGLDTVHSSDVDEKSRTLIANFIGYLLITVYQGAEERQLSEMQECTQAIYGGFHDNLGGPAQIALSAGWAGWFSHEQDYNVLTPSREDARRLADRILAGAESIAAGGAAPSILDPSIKGEWQGVELSLVINGNRQRIPLNGPLLLEANGLYRVNAESVFVDTGRWSYHDSVLKFRTDQLADKLSISYNVTFHGDQMWWEITKHDGQWIERWVWQR